MATLFVTVWEDAKEVALGLPSQQFTVTIGSGSVKSTKINQIDASDNRHKRIRLMADGKCFVNRGDTNVIADQTGANGWPMGSENPEYHSIQAGQFLAVIERV